MSESSLSMSEFCDTNNIKRIANDDFCDSSGAEQSKDDSASPLTLTECSDTENQCLNSDQFLRRDENSTMVKSRKNRKKASVQFWKLRTLASEDFDPRRLTERQQIAYFAAQTATDKKNQLASSPFRLDRLMADAEVSSVGGAPPAEGGASSSSPPTGRPRHSSTRSPLAKSKSVGSANHGKDGKRSLARNRSVHQQINAVMPPQTPNGFKESQQIFYASKSKMLSPSTSTWSNVAAGSSVQDLAMDDEPLSSTLGPVVQRQPLNLPSSVLDVDMMDAPSPVSLQKSAILLQRPVPLLAPLIVGTEASRLIMSDDNSVDDTFNSSCPDDVIVRHSSEDYSNGKQMSFSQSFSSLEVQIAQFLASCDAVRRRKSEIAASFQS